MRIARVTYDKNNGENGPGEAYDLLNKIGNQLVAANKLMVQANDLSMSKDEIRAVEQYKSIPRHYR